MAYRMSSVYRTHDLFWPCSCTADRSYGIPTSMPALFKALPYTVCRIVYTSYTVSQYFIKFYGPVVEILLDYWRTHCAQLSLLSHGILFYKMQMYLLAHSADES